MDRTNLKRYAKYALATIVALVLMFAVAPAFAAELAYDGHGVSLRLSAGPCADKEVLSRIPPVVHANYQAGSGVVNGKQFALCWRALNPSTVHVQWSDGDGDMVPISVLRPAEKQKSV